MKRARTENVETATGLVPEWLADAPLSFGQLNGFLGWLDDHGYCIAERLPGHVAGTHDHPASAVIAMGYKGATENIYCDRCVEHCPCCAEACDHLYDPDDGPHDQLCYHCWMGDRDPCECAYPCEKCGKEFVQRSEGEQHEKTCIGNDESNSVSSVDDHA